MLDDVIDDAIERDRFFRKQETACVQPEGCSEMLVDSSVYYSILKDRFRRYTEKQLTCVLAFLSSYCLRTAECTQVKRKHGKKRFDADEIQAHYVGAIK